MLGFVYLAMAWLSYSTKIWLNYFTVDLCIGTVASIHTVGLGLVLEGHLKKNHYFFCFKVTL